MSSSSAPADTAPPPPGMRGGERDRSAPIPPGNARSGKAASGNIAAGLPVDELPPLVELSGFDEPLPQPGPALRPPRRSFLAPVAVEATAPAAAPAPAPAVAAPSPELAEPTPAPAHSAAILTPAAPGITVRWLAKARALWPSGRRRRLAAGMGLVVAAVLVIALFRVAGIGPFVDSGHYPVTAAPSDPAQRLAYFQRGAQAGDAEAELQLAIIYARGEGVAQDYASSANWFRAAANQGVARAQYDLGVLYERGRGVAADPAEAARWYLKSAQAGYPLAQYNLAVCYTRGQGLRQDLAEAALWYRRAAVQGVVQAMINLATMYDKGEGIAGSPVDAYAWYRGAGRRDNQPAAHRADDIFNALPRLDQIRAEALASDVAASIHDPKPQAGEAPAGTQDAKSAAPTH